jgi:hypothetical protein
MAQIVNISFDIFWITWMISYIDQNLKMSWLFFTSDNLHKPWVSDLTLKWYEYDYHRTMARLKWAKAYPDE